MVYLLVFIRSFLILEENLRFSSHPKTDFHHDSTLPPPFPVARSFAVAGMGGRVDGEVPRGGFKVILFLTGESLLFPSC